MTAKMHQNFNRVLCLQYKHRVKKSKEFVVKKKSYARLKFRKIVVFVSKWLRLSGRWQAPAATEKDRPGAMPSARRADCSRNVSYKVLIPVRSAESYIGIIFQVLKNMFASVHYIKI